MKATEISVQIVKNVGSYESIRMMATYSLDEGDNTHYCILEARKQLEDSFSSMYPPKPRKYNSEPVNGLELLTPTHGMFNNVCKALHEGNTSIEEVVKHFEVSREAMDYFKKNNLV
jgi:hypothetical protein